MLHKSKIAAIFLTVLLSVNCTQPCRAGEGIMGFYQKHISPVDGDRCPMYPSCSHYAQAAVKKHGLLVGWVMACDRLVRCGRDETRLSRPVDINGRVHAYDPVEANDFWWFNAEKEK